MEIECGPENDKRTLKVSLPPVEKVGVFVSGGIDSALLYYLLLAEKYFLQSNHQIYPIVIYRKEGSKYFAEPVIKKINSIFDHALPTKRLGNTTLPEVQQVKSAVEQAFRLPPYFQSVFIGVIQNRPEHVVGFDPIPLPEEKDNVLMPLKHLEKTHIVDLYFRLGINHLLKYTHSCDQNEQLLCHVCNGCRERAWAFDQLNLQDPRTNESHT